MQSARLITNYNTLSVDQVSPTAHSVSTQIKTSSLIADGPKRVQKLEADTLALDTMVMDTPTPNTAQNATLKNLRRAVTAEMGVIAKQLNLDYPGDTAALLSSGLELVTASNHARPIELPPTDVMFTDAPQLYYLLLKFKRPKGAVVTLIRYSTDPDLPEANWLVAVGGGRERLLGPFAAGTKVWAKVAGLNGSTTEPDYSVVVCRIVQ